MYIWTNIYSLTSTFTEFEPHCASQNVSCHIPNMTFEQTFSQFHMEIFQYASGRMEFPCKYEDLENINQKQTDKPNTRNANRMEPVCPVSTARSV